MNIDAYEKWLHHMANVYLGAGSPDHDDLVNEGRLAIWKANKTWDEARGTKAPWVTRAAKMRMRDVAHGHGRYTGHAAHRGSPPVRAVPVDEITDEWVPAHGDHAGSSALAYHHAEIRKAIARLSAGQRKATELVLLGAVLDSAQRNAWAVARKRLAADLAHLAGAL